MLPWVLLYGFTALLFNHPKFWSDSSSTSFTISPSDGVAVNFDGGEFARQLVDEANQVATGQELLLDPAVGTNFRFTAQVLRTIEDKDSRISISIDANHNTGTGRKTTTEPKTQSDQGLAEPSLRTKLPVHVPFELESQLRLALADIIREQGGDPSNLQFRSLPAFEFDALVDGNRNRIRFTPQVDRGRGLGRIAPNRPVQATPPTDADSAIASVSPALQVSGFLSIVGENPRDLSLRSQLLRLHTAHGYPSEIGSRWVWAIAVDAMFASMCFWGISGVVMWWQIKRTRFWGAVCLLASALVASILAFGMHYQFVYG